MLGDPFVLREVMEMLYLKGQVSLALTRKDNWHTPSSRVNAEKQGEGLKRRLRSRNGIQPYPFTSLYE